MDNRKRLPDKAAEELLSAKAKTKGPIKWNQEIAEEIFLEAQSRTFLLRRIPCNVVADHILKDMLATYFGMSTIQFKWFLSKSVGYPTTQARVTFKTKEFYQQAKEKIKQTKGYFSLQTPEGDKIYSFLDLYVEESLPATTAVAEELEIRLGNKPLPSVGKHKPIRPMEADETAVRKSIETKIQPFMAQMKDRQRKLAEETPIKGKGWKVLNEEFEFFYSPSVEDLIGKGSVFFGRRKSIDKEWVAVKTFAEELEYTPADVNVLQDLKNEEPYVVRLFADGTLEGLSIMPTSYIVIELCPVDLQTFLSKTPITEAEGKWIITEVCRAVESLHNASFIHRDLRPSNILITHRGGLKLADFGFSRKISSITSNSQVTATSGAHLQPIEVQKALLESREFQLTSACDMFMLGMCISFIASGGRYPFGKGNHDSQYLEIYNGASPDPFLYNHIKDPLLRPLLENLLSHIADERFGIVQARKHPYFYSYADRENKIIRFHEKCTDKSVKFEELLPLRNHPQFHGWFSKVPPRVQNAIVLPPQARETTAGLITFIRHGLLHSKDWDVLTHNEMLKEQGPVKELFRTWDSVNEFFFNHSSVAWVLPALVAKSMKLHRYHSDKMKEYAELASLPQEDAM